ncbi:SDR family NAD(P)-dependent oxidoreductase [Streptomyces chrestomyceticus]|uniref:SDR family NAD(P)-dependent oxidoreductase n=1 Tax=Streptomyces chrestomyceticus TaxID=68185 RepID=A0ABU7WUL7_9ACTN
MSGISGDGCDVSSAPWAEPVAVIGAACRAPGGVDSLAALWRLLADERETVGPVPRDRWDADALAAGLPEGVACRIKRGGFLEGDLGAFDAQAFGISGAEATWMDPQHRLLLMIAWEACEHAGIPVDALRGSQTGVFAGMYWMDNYLRGHRSPQETEGYWFSGGVHGVGVGRVAYLLDLHGPSLSVDTACSSSLVAVHLACQSLRAGECGMALAGGVAAGLGPEVTIASSRWEMFSPTGRCHAFDKKADGYLRAEGCGVVVLKLLKDARRDGDRVLAVLRGSAVNQDGRSVRLTAPSAQAQAAVFAAALRRAGVRGEQVGMIEAHGTGTTIGDPLEFSAIKEVYGAGDYPCAVGSIKTNIGHTEAASGVMGLLKAIASLRHGRVPATLHFTEFHPQIDAGECRLHVPTSMESWPVPQGPRLAAVSSYGVGGTNAHVIVEAAGDDAATREGQESVAEEGGRAVYLLSGSSQAAVRRHAARLADWLDSGDGRSVPLADIAHTLAVRRSHGAQRAAVVAASHDELVSRLRQFGAQEETGGTAAGSVRPSGPGPVFVYSGHGSQWAGMCQGLLDTDEAFTAVIDELEPLLRQEAGFSLREVLVSEDTVTGVARVQPTLFAVQVALTAMWRARGVEPAAVIGHSMGEVAAAVACGALSVQDGVRVICRRARLLTRVTGGAMAAVQLSAGHVRQALVEQRAAEVEIAVIAAPESTVISGDAGTVERLVCLWERDGIGVARIQVDVASHSAQMDPILDDLRERLSELAPGRPGRRFYTTVADDPRAELLLDADYWVANQRRPVRFAAAVEAAAADGHRAFVEINVHAMLARAITATLAGCDAFVTPTLLRHGDEVLDFETHVAGLHCQGVPIAWHRQYGRGRLAEVPATCWDPGHHWIEPSALTCGGMVADAGGEPPHPLLGTRVRDPREPGRHLWQCDLAPHVTAWLRDHHAAGAPAMPGAAWAEMALSAARTIAPGGLCPRVRDLTFDAFLPLGTGGTRLISQGELRTEREASWQVASHTAGGGFERHSHATLTAAPQAAGPPPAQLDSLHAACPQHIDITAVRERWRTSCGISYGSAFDVIATLHVSPDGHAPEALAAVAIPDAARLLTRRFQWHPALLDGCLQSLLALWTTRIGLPPGSAYPLGIGELQVHGATADGVWCHVRATSLDTHQITGSLCLLNADGAVLAHADAIRFLHQPAHKTGRLQRYFHQLHWQRQDLIAPARTETGNWLAVTEGEPQGWHKQLLTELAARTPLTRLPIPADADEATLGDQLDAALTQTDPAFTDLLLIARQDDATDDQAVARAHRRIAHTITTVQHLDRIRPTTRLHLITHHTHSLPGDQHVALAHAGIRGLHRVLTYEHPALRPTLLDTDTLTSPGRIAAQLLTDDPEDEVAWRTDQRYVLRITPAPLTPHERRTISCTPHATPLQADTDGTTLTYTVQPSVDTPPGETTITVTATCSTDLGDDLPLMPCAGTTDHGTVAALVPTTAPTSRTTAAAHWTVPVPATSNAPQIACSLLPYLAAHYALHHLARLAAGERLLLHGATGTLTAAARHTATAAGADISISTPDKEPGLRLPARTVRPDQLADINPRFDVILDTDGRAAQDFGSLLAPGGRLITSRAGSRRPPTVTNHNTLTCTLDLASVLRDDADTASALLAEIGQALVQETLPPLPCTDHPLADLALTPGATPRDARPAVYRWPHGPLTAHIPPQQIPLIRPDGGYVITGGLGGLGLVLCRWLTGHGAGTIILSSRSSPTAEAATAIERLRTTGTRIDIISADIAEPGTAERLLQAAQRHGHRLRGIIHGAAVVDDAAIIRITPGLLERVWRPKANGAWLLHQASTRYDLDWWVAFSSFVPIIGSPGQAAYAAASAWLDELITHRRAAGLPALGINWGAWAEVGIGARTIGDRGFATIPLTDALDGLELLLTHARTHSSFVNIDFDKWLAPYPQAAAAPFFSNLLRQSTAALTTSRHEDPLAALRSADSSRRPALLARFITAQAAELLYCDPDRIAPHTSLLTVGVDSMIATQLLNRLQQSVGLTIPQSVLWANPTVTALTDYTLNHLPHQSPHTAPDPIPPNTPSLPPHTPARPAPPP